jgi:hypothetical protein
MSENNPTVNAEMILNAFTSRSDMLGKLFDPRRDIDDECGYAKTINETQYRQMYDREIGRRVVNVYPEETWKKMPRVYEDADPEVSTPFEESLAAFESKHHLFHFMQRADELSGIGHYGVILWGVGDGKQLHEPVDGWESWEESTGSPRTTEAPENRIHFIRVLDESLCRVGSYEADVGNPRYGLPTSYVITLVDPRNLESDATVTQPNKNDTVVHWTRITHLADNRKTSETIGTPRMEPVWNRLYDLRKVLGGSGEMYWKGGFPGISLETQPGLENATLDKEATREMMSDYMNGLQRYVALTGMSAKSLAPQISDPSQTFEVQIKAICVTLGIPYRVFMGIEEGVVSGDQATQAWAGRLMNRQERYVTPMLIDPIIQRLIEYGALKPTAEPQGWNVEWPDLTAPNEKDKAEVAVRKTDAFAKYVAGGVDTLIPPLAFLTIVCGMEEDSAMAILDAAIEHIGAFSGDDAVEGEIVPGRVPTPPELQGDNEPDAKEEEEGDED